MGTCCLSRTGYKSLDRYQAARSVHVWWQSADGEPLAFYNEACVHKTTPGSNFMVCGFDGGYFSMTDTLEQGYRLSFSVCDASIALNPGHDANTAESVKVLYQAPDVTVEHFGGEGVGAQCTDNSTGWAEEMRIGFLVFCKRGNRQACYAAYVKPDVRSPNSSWKHVVTFKVACGKRFRGFQSFIEDFRRDGISAVEERRCTFGPAWVFMTDLNWHPALSANFTASSAEWEHPDNIDILPSLSPGTLTLATGGAFLSGASKLQSSLPLEAGRNGPPEDYPLPRFQVDDAVVSDSVAISQVTPQTAKIEEAQVSQVVTSTPHEAPEIKRTHSDSSSSGSSDVSSIDGASQITDMSADNLETLDVDVLLALIDAQLDEIMDLDDMDGKSRLDTVVKSFKAELLRDHPNIDKELNSDLSLERFDLPKERLLVLARLAGCRFAGSSGSFVMR